MVLSTENEGIDADDSAVIGNGTIGIISLLVSVLHGTTTVLKTVHVVDGGMDVLMGVEEVGPVVVVVVAVAVAVNVGEDGATEGIITDVEVSLDEL